MPPVTVGPLEGVCVLGGGTAFPSRRLTNAEVLGLLPREAWGKREVTEPEELAFLAQGLEQTLGVRERAWAHQVGRPLDHHCDQNSLDLGVEAAKAALKDAGIEARALSLILCATSTPHRMTSTVSAALGAAIGANAACMDTRTGCAAGIFGLTTGALFLAAGTGPVLLVGTETFSKIIPSHSKLGAVSLADGAGAVVLGRRDGKRLEAAFLETDGRLGRLITTEGALPPTVEEIARGGYLISGAPEELAGEVPGKYLLAISPERCFLNVHRHANIGAAGWLVASVGGGMSWGAAILRC
jgi:3-oxoacyl-[acyl-carrier-protein] synthase III